MNSGNQARLRFRGKKKKQNYVEVPLLSSNRGRNTHQNLRNLRIEKKENQHKGKGLSVSASEEKNAE